MLTRSALTALDHNSNCGRRQVDDIRYGHKYLSNLEIHQAQTRDGRARFDLVKNRFGNKW